MECDENATSAESNPIRNAENAVTSRTPHEQPSPDTEERGPQEKTKRQKHTKVHKREQELYGLVTPVFLPLLDARDTSLTSHKGKKEKKQSRPERAEETKSAPDAEQAATPRHAEKSREGRKSKKEIKDMEGVVSADPVKQSPQIEAVKKSKRSGVKKSALRHKDTPRSRRKRVSLVIDGQTVLPADTVVVPPLTSPSSEATSASNSTASLDELIDPCLTRPDFDHNAVHHSLPLPMTHSHSPSKPLAETPTSLVIENEHSPPLSATLSPSIPFAPPATATCTFLDPSPSQMQPTSIPRTAGPNPIYSNSVSSDLIESAKLAEQDEEDLKASNWETYVGGLHGSGVDDVDQAGSYGYPSSLGASYLESYMQSRPLSVRMQTADKAGLDEREKREMLLGRGEEARRRTEDVEDDAEFGRRDGRHARRGDADDDMDITGTMDF